MFSFISLANALLFRGTANIPRNRVNEIDKRIIFFHFFNLTYLYLEIILLYHRLE